MATLIGQRIRFLHTPKTGGTWATEAMFAAGLEVDAPHNAPFHASLRDTSDYADLFTFAFVRHPLGFWRSYWGYRMRTGWVDEIDIDRVAASEDLNEFATRLVAYAPGWASDMYEHFVGPPACEIDMICRHERLADDLCAALRLAGLEFDERRLRSHPRVNVSDYGDPPALYERRTAELLAESEAKAISRFYPWQELPQHVLAPSARRTEATPGRLAQLEQTTLALRDTRAELAGARRALARSTHRCNELQARAGEAELSLARMRASRLLRWSRPARIAWYATRRRAGASRRRASSRA